MKSIRPLLMFRVMGMIGVIGVIATILAGCAGGPRQDALEEAMPALKPGYGRIYFMRSSAFLGSPVQPEIQLNGQVVGRSRPRGFFFVDKPAGPYRASSSTSVATAVQFDLYPGETKYIRTEVNIAVLGIMPGSVSFILMDESMAEPELRKLRYTGRAVQPPSRQAAKPAATNTATAPAPAAAMPAADATTESVSSPTLAPPAQ